MALYLHSCDWAVLTITKCGLSHCHISATCRTYSLSSLISSQYSRQTDTHTRNTVTPYPQSFILQCLRPVHSLFQSQFSTQCDLVLPLAISSILFFPSRSIVAAYAFFFVFPSLLFFPSIFPSIAFFRRQFLRKM